MRVKAKQAGFVMVEAVLVVVIVAAVVGVGYYVVHQKHVADKTLSSSANSGGSTASAAKGTTASIDKITQQDAATETSVDKTADNSYQQDATSSNGAVSNLGGAYNEASY